MSEGLAAGGTGEAANPHIPVDAVWLARRQEAILAPELAIVDAHHHLWDRAYYRYLFPEFLADLHSGHNVVGSVFVECHAMYRARGPETLRPVGETEFAAGIAAMFASGAYGVPQACAGIVAHADLRLGAGVEAVLDAHASASGGRLRGIRQVFAWHDSVRGTIVKAPPHLLADPAFREGFSRLAPRGLIFDAWGYHSQLAEVLDLARAFPETIIVIDHAGTPIGIGPYAGRREEVRAEWRRSMTALAGCANIRVKLSGLAMRVCGFAFHEREMPPSSEELAATWRPIIEPVIELFGAGRCLFASNFPVDKGATSYPVLWNAFKILTQNASPHEQAQLFCENARQVYGMKAA